MSKDKDIDKDLRIGPRGSSKTRTFVEDNNTANWPVSPGKLLTAGLQLQNQTADFTMRLRLYGNAVAVC